jgi:hypothetical protein
MADTPDGDAGGVDAGQVRQRPGSVVVVLRVLDRVGLLARLPVAGAEAAVVVGEHGDPRRLELAGDRPAACSLSRVSPALMATAGAPAASALKKSPRKVTPSTVGISTRTGPPI